VVDGADAIKRIEAAGGKFLSAAGDSGDSSPNGQFQRNVFLAMAEFERDSKREGFEKAQLQAIERGIFIGSRIPTGYTRDPATRRLVPNEMAPVVRRLFEMRADGATWTDLVKYFVASGGNPETSRQTLMNMLRNPTYLGWSRHGEKVNEKAHEPIVSQRLFDIASTRDVPRKHTGRAAAESLLGGLVRCDNCGKMLRTSTNGRKKLVYSCNHPGSDIRAGAYVADLDAEVVARLHSAWETYRLAAVEISGSNEATLEAELILTREAHSDAEHLLVKSACQVRSRQAGVPQGNGATRVRG
jgi:hypothetical protein